MIRIAAVSLDGAAFLAGVPALLEIAVRLLFGTPLFGPGWLIATTIIAKMSVNAIQPAATATPMLLSIDSRPCSAFPA